MNVFRVYFLHVLVHEVCSSCCYESTRKQNVTESNKNRVIQQAVYHLVESSCLNAAISIGAKRIIVAEEEFIQI